MTLGQWNSCLAYAQDVCKCLSINGIAVRASGYQLFNGRRGICLQVVDNNATVFAEYYTGTYDTVNEMQSALDVLEKRIIKECL